VLGGWVLPLRANQTAIATDRFRKLVTAKTNTVYWSMGVSGHVLDREARTPDDSFAHGLRGDTGSVSVSRRQRSTRLWIAGCCRMWQLCVAELDFAQNARLGRIVVDACEPG
jgi:hypothetical protein